MQQPGSPTKFTLDQQPDSYLDLWKWFTEDAAKIKDKMWTIASFLYTLLGAMLGYAAKYFSFDNEKTFSLAITQPAMVGMICIMGCLLSGYGSYMLKEYGKHIRRSWNRANYIRFRIEGLSEIICYDDAERIKEDNQIRLKTDNRIPAVAMWLIMIMGFFFIIFFILFILVLNQ